MEKMDKDIGIQYWDGGLDIASVLTNPSMIITSPALAVSQNCTTRAILLDLNLVWLLLSRHLPFR